MVTIRMKKMTPIYKMMTVLISFILINCISTAKELPKNIITLPDSEIITVDDDGDEEYLSINEAIDAANPGTIIFVYSGVYTENLIVNKHLLLVGMKDEGEDIPIINSVNSSDDTITIDADNCIIYGFKIFSPGDYKKAGIKINSNNNLIEKNIILNGSFFGILLNQTENNRISNNTIYNNNWGVKLSYSNKNFITKNNFQNNWIGNYLHCSSENIIEENNFVNNYYGIASMYQSNSNNFIKNNFYDNDYGLDLWKSNSNNIEENIISDSKQDGIRIWGCKNNNIKYNNLTNNARNGIQIYYGLSQKIIGNNFINNTLGLFLRSRSKFHSIKNNNFVNNKNSATFYSSCFNYWNSNYWDDSDGKRIYVIKGKIGSLKKQKIEIRWVNIDLKPLEEPFSK